MLYPRLRPAFLALRFALLTMMTLNRLLALSISFLARFFTAARWLGLRALSCLKVNN